MYLDYSKLPVDTNGNPETPELMLRTLHGEAIGVIHGAHNLKMNIKFVEPSEITFDVPSLIDGVENPIYESVTGYKQIYTQNYGIYVTEKPKKSSDGIMEVKHITAYSIEKMMENKNFFLEEGVYKFCNITNVSDTNTIIGRILEIDPTWNIGYVAPAVASKYGAFDQYDGKLLSFMQNNVMQKFRCVFVFDPYGTAAKPGKTISVYDVDEERDTIPIYLDFDNLLLNTDVEELTDELVTAIRPYGADELSIHEVNPTGDDWVYDLSGFIARGDISGDLAAAYLDWQSRMLNARAYYSGLTAARASMWSRYYMEQAQYNALQGELDGLLAQQNVAIQGGHSSVLSSLYTQIENKKAEIAAKTSSINTITSNIVNISNAISDIVNGTATTRGIALGKSMTDEQYKALLPYIIQQDVTDDTFVASDISTDMTPTTHAVNGATISISSAAISRVSLTTGYNCTMYSITGGSFAVSNAKADIIRGTLEVDSGNKFTMSLYTGTITIGNTTAPDGIITVSGTISGSIQGNITTKNTDGVITYEGTWIKFKTGTANLYLTASAGEFQRWAVEQQLYDYAVDLLNDLAVPTYQFEVQSGNFIFASEFAPFRNALELGKGIYLNLPGEQTITPYLIEFELDFEDRSKFSLVFSNRFKRADNVNTLKDIIEKTYSSGKSFDIKKHGYNTAESDATDAAKFIRESLDFAANRIKSASNQTVVIDPAGIQIGGESNRQMRIVNDMLAITDDGWQHAKLAIGYFETPNDAKYFGVNAEVIAGNLIVGTELNISTSAGHFRVDNSGVYIDSMKFFITHGGTNQSLNDEFADIRSSADHDLFNALNALNDFTADPNVAIFYEGADPRNTHTVQSSDIWYLTKNGVSVNGTTYNAGTIFQWNETRWVKKDDSDLRNALDNAKAAQDTADGKVMFWRYTAPPPIATVTSTTSPWYGFDKTHATGDLWYNTSTSAVTSGGVTYTPQKLYRFNGTKWELVEDGDIQKTKDNVANLKEELYNVYDNVHQTVKASTISGTISATSAMMKASNGNVLFQNDGMWLLRYNGSSRTDGDFLKVSGNYAVWMNEYGILFGSYTGSAKSGKAGDISYTDENGWTWTTAINHAGVTANSLVGKEITGITISGSTLRIGPNASATKGFNFYVDSNGNLYANNGEFKGTIKASKVNGNLTSDGTGWLIGCGIKVGGSNVLTSPNFMVDTAGNVTMKGSITLSGTITWNSNSQLPSSKVSGLSAVATSGSYTDLYNKPAIPVLPSYITSTKITETTIESPTITGATIRGAEFTNTTSGAYLIVGDGQYGDMYLYSRSRDRYGNVRNVWETFRVYDDVGSVGLCLYGDRVMTYNPTTQILYFNKSVSGISTTAKFG